MAYNRSPKSQLQFVAGYTHAPMDDGCAVQLMAHTMMMRKKVIFHYTGPGIPGGAGQVGSTACLQNLTCHSPYPKAQLGSEVV